MTEYEIQEYIKCRENPVYFLEKYGKVRHPTRGLVNFKLWDFQRKCVQDFIEYSYNIILKGRQLGLSTLVAGYIAWLIMFFDNKEVFVLATKSAVASNLIAKIRVFIEELPEWLIPAQKNNNVQSVWLENGSRVQASSTTENAIRSEALSLLVIDEAAFIRNISGIWTSAQPALSTGGDCIVLSTPNGAQGWFYNKYADAESGMKDKIGNFVKRFNPIKLSWRDHPERDQSWADEMKNNISPKEFAQEHDGDFLMSGDSVFDQEALLWFENNYDPYCENEKYIRQPLYKKGIDDYLWIWKDPVPGNQYILSADVAKGDSADFSAFQIIEVTEYEQVAEYKGKVVPELFAQMILETAKFYNTALVVVENNSYGLGVLEDILQDEYPNVYYSQRKNSLSMLNKDEEIVDIYNPGKNAIAGFTTSGKTRPVMLMKMEEDIRKKDVIIHSSRLLSELKTFTMINGKPQASEDAHDDLVMSFGIGMYARNVGIKLNLSNELQHSMINHFTQESKKYSELFEENKEVKRNGNTIKIPAIHKNAIATVNEFKWLL